MWRHNKVKQLLQINILFLNSWFCTANLLLKKEKETLWHTVASMLFGTRVRMDSTAWVNKINRSPLYFTIWMWSSYKDTFSVFCQYFHNLSGYQRNSEGKSPVFSSDPGQCHGSVTFLMSAAIQLVNPSHWPCLLSLLQMHSWKGPIVPSCSMHEVMHSPFIIRRQA